MHTSEFLNFRCQTYFYRILQTQNPFVLAHELIKNPIDLISCEANRIPFVSQSIDLNLWAD